MQMPATFSRLAAVLAVAAIGAHLLMLGGLSTRGQILAQTGPHAVLDDGQGQAATELFGYVESSELPHAAPPVCLAAHSEDEAAEPDPEPVPMSPCASSADAIDRFAPPGAVLVEPWPIPAATPARNTRIRV
jgi:hypothetical protein